MYAVTSIELFAGAGGLALGLEKAGISGQLFVEIDHWACETLRANRPNWNIVESDVHEVDFTDYAGEIDLVSGGAPCQAFSYAGKRLGFGDTRGTLFAEFARCVRETRPKMFLFENVRGLLSHDKGRTLSTIIHVLESLEYKLEYRVLNACYFGVGQKRERLFIVGTRMDLVNEIHFNYPLPEKKWTTLREVLKNVPDSPFQPYSEKNAK